jgi:succinylglutamate desuccinylase
LNTSTIALRAENVRFSRVLGRYEGTAPGPTLIVTGGLHGNEPAGAVAARHVLDLLSARAPALRGRVVALAGNLAALAQDRRYLDRDLNRLWTSEAVSALRVQDPALDCVEEREQRALLEILEREREASSGPLTLLDLHTTSGGGPPFSLMSDTLPNRRLAMFLLVPVMLGLEESIDGTLLEYATRRGDVAVVVEGGGHAEPVAVKNHEAVIWHTLVAIGCLRRDDVPDIEAHAEQLRRAAVGMPRFHEVRYHHPVHAGDAFRMEPGFTGLQPVERGRLLARDNAGEIRASESGRLLMPLYQAQGTDGFFLVRPVSGFWLSLSVLLRTLRLDALLPFLPGVTRDDESAGSLRVDRRVARWFVVEVFHLLGYHRRLQREDVIVFTHRVAERG